jgi:hypothetical protein
MLLQGATSAAQRVAVCCARNGIQRDGEPASMDPFLVMLGCLICTMTALIFVEVRRIRKKLEQRMAEPAAAKPAS